MKKFARRDYTLELVTPAFLGGADQSAEWRTPGIKALIRQWWRVAYVAEHGVNVERMLEQEGLRFGSTQEFKGPHDRDPSLHKAAISIRFDGLPPSQAEQVEPVRGDRNQSLPYLGFGPFVQPTQPSTRKALSHGSKTKLQVIIKGHDNVEADRYAQEMDTVFALIARFGTLGSRSRNGWGSLKLTGPTLQALNPEKFARPLDDSLRQDWMTGIATDRSGLMLWQTPVKTDWKSVMTDLKAARKEHQNLHAKNKRLRAVINGPAPGNPARWPNQFMFKVLPTNGGFVGQIALMAHQWPGDTPRQLALLLQEIANNLDKQNHIYKRIKS